MNQNKVVFEFNYLSQAEKEEVNNSVLILDKIINDIVIPFSEMNKQQVILAFSRIFSAKSEQLINHYLDDFFKHEDYNIGRYFLNCDDEMINSIFDYYKIPMSEIISQSWFDKNGRTYFMFAFEVLLNQKFFLFANNNSLEELNQFSFFDELKPILKRNYIQFYGNCLNWSKAWQLFNDAMKNEFVYFLIYKYNI